MVDSFSVLLENFLEGSEPEEWERKLEKLWEDCEREWERKNLERERRERERERRERELAERRELEREWRERELAERLQRWAQLAQQLIAPPQGLALTLLSSLMFIMLVVLALELVGWFTFLGLLVTILAYLLLIITFGLTPIINAPASTFLDGIRVDAHINGHCALSLDPCHQYFRYNGCQISSLIP
ncbi:hypothetical protein MVEN_02214000 [Mycena venus]|uniref:Uncharacterized protein n=1 Tax=Mycena venus TaxID=2733690 RepID=A0A8H6X7U9_9AGAR|nr:hypothetical protein MVEN_02214000 [Mycena venus]